MEIPFQGFLGMLRGVLGGLCGDSMSPCCHGKWNGPGNYECRVVLSVPSTLVSDRLYP